MYLDPPEKEIGERTFSKLSGTSIEKLEPARKCSDCGKWHNTVVENTHTLEVIERIDKCMDCLFKGCRCHPLKEHITLEAIDASEQPLADQLAKAYNHFVLNNSFTDRMERGGNDDEN